VRLKPLILAASLVAPSLAIVQSPAAAWTARPATYQAILERDHRVTMTDGVRLAVDVIRPGTSGTLPQCDPVPPSTGGAPRQPRYWSLCQYELITERFVACSADHQSVIGEDGYARFVISDPSDRPSNATTSNAINWLPWGGPYYDGFIGRLPVPGPARLIRVVL
jgi:hypothetical protein